jgi:nucleoid-associated protein EbfC
MFDKLKGLAGLAGIAKDLPRIKARMQEVKERLPDVVCQGSAGGGAVTVTANGRMRITSVRVEPALFSGLAMSDTAARAMAEEFIVEAANAALERAQQAAAKELARAAEELNLPIPPGALDDLL